MNSREDYLRRRQQNRLAAESMDIARAQAWKMYNKSKVSIDDLMFEAMAALGEACVKYDPEQDATFRAYARDCIWGKLCNYLRDTHRVVRLPRPISSQYMYYHRLYKANPGKHEKFYADQMGISVAELQQLLAESTLFHAPQPIEFADDSSQAEPELTDSGVLAERVISAGVAFVARESGETADKVQAEFYVALRKLLEHHEFSK